MTWCSVYTYIYIYTYFCIDTYVHIHKYVYYTYIDTYINMYVLMCIYIYIYINKYSHIHIIYNLYIYIYTHDLYLHTSARCSYRYNFTGLQHGCDRLVTTLPSPKKWASRWAGEHGDDGDSWWHVHKLRDLTWQNYGELWLKRYWWSRSCLSTQPSHIRGK